MHAPGARATPDELPVATTSQHYPAQVATFILTVLGDDRPGLVSALSAPVSAHGGSWERSELTRLAGHGYFDGTRLTAEGLAYSDAIGPWLVSPGVRAAMSGYAAR